MRLRYTPGVVCPPGDIILEIMKERKLSHNDVAKAMLYKPRVLDEIVNGKRPIDPCVAWRLEGAFGVRASFWLNLEKNYRDNQGEPCEP